MLCTLGGGPTLWHPSIDDRTVFTRWKNKLLILNSEQHDTFKTARGTHESFLPRMIYEGEEGWGRTDTGQGGFGEGSAQQCIRSHRGGREVREMIRNGGSSEPFEASERQRSMSRGSPTGPRHPPSSSPRAGQTSHTPKRGILSGFKWIFQPDIPPHPHPQPTRPK